MSAERGPSDALVRRWAALWPRLSARYVFPPLAAASVGTSILWWYQSGGAPGVAPGVLLAALGGTTLATSAGLARVTRGRSSAPEPRGRRAPSRGPSGRTSVSRVAPSSLERRPTVDPVVRPRGPVLPSADLLWEATTPPIVGELPVALVGPVAEVPFVPPEALDPIAFAIYGERSRAEGTPPSVRARWPEVPFEVDFEGWSPGGGPSMGPMLDTVGLEALTATPPHLRPASAPASVPTAALRAGPLDPSPASAPRRDFVDLEATTAMPPHLRPSAPPSNGRRPRSPEDACATCESALAQVPSWQRCTVCRDPLCSECLVRALVDQERAWCRGCVAWDAVEESYRSLNTATVNPRSAS